MGIGWNILNPVHNFKYVFKTVPASIFGAITGSTAANKQAQSAQASADKNAKAANNLALKQMQQQREQFDATMAANEKAKKDADIRSQDSTAAQSQNQANLAAQGYGGAQTSFQKALDLASTQAASSAAAGAGAAQVGMQIGAPVASKMSAMPAAQTISSPAGQTPAPMAAKSLSSFYLPNTTGLQFGGS